MQKNLLRYFIVSNIIIFIGILFFLYNVTKRPYISEPPSEIEKAIESKVSNPEPQEVGDNLSHEILYTINASSMTDWVYFDFSKGAIVNVNDRASPDWDIGFRRAKIITNGGESNPNGNGGILPLEGVQFESVVEAPESGYMTDIRKNAIETENPAIDKWYVYNYLSHELKPKKNVYIIRTVDGRYVKMQIIKYYCKEMAGCYTIRYVYQGNGSRQFTAL
jgi:hypothetical protein